MGEHKGWSLDTLPSGSTRVRVRDPATGITASKTFPKGQREVASAWGRQQSAKYSLGRERAVAAVVSTKDQVDDYVRELGRRGSVPQHIHDCQRVLELFAKAVPDLGAKDTERKCLDWWDALPSSRELTKGQVLKPGQKPKPLAAHTCNRYLRYVRALMAHAVDHDQIGRSPVRHIRLLTPDEPLPPQFSIEELRRALARPRDSFAPTFALLVYSGMRISEALALRWSEVDLSAKIITVVLREGVRIKRRRERVIPIQPELLAILSDVRQCRGADTCTGEARVVDREQGNIGRSFERFLKRSSIPVAGRSPHACRHTYGGLMTATCVPTSLLADYLGHSVLKTTADYSRMAARFRQGVESWKAGEFQLFTAATMAELSTKPVALAG